MMATVLLVEDEPDIQQVIAYNLERAGHTVVRTASAEEARDRVRTRRQSS